jgi:hypothetical protein
MSGPLIGGGTSLLFHSFGDLIGPFEYRLYIFGMHQSHVWLSRLMGGISRDWFSYFFFCATERPGYIVIDS